MTRVKQRNNAAIEYANAVTDDNQDAWFDVVLKTHQDATVWADKTMIKRACEWLEHFDVINYKDFNQDDGIWVFNRNSFIEDFKKAME